MQVEPSPSLSRLDLSDQGELFGITHEGIDGTVIRHALVTALNRVPEGPALPWTGWRLRVLAEAGRILLSEAQNFAAAIRLTQVAAPSLSDTAALAHVRLIAMWQMGLRNETIDEANRIMALSSLPLIGRKVIRDALRKWNIERSLLCRIEHLYDFWPDVDSAIADPFGVVNADGPQVYIDYIGPNIARINGLQPDNAAFLNGMKWGSEVHRRILYTRRLAQIIKHKPVAQINYLEEKVLELERSIYNHIVDIDISTLEMHVNCQRSVIIANAHAGLSTAHHLGLLPSVPFPYSVVSEAAGPAVRPQDYHLATGGPNVALGFAKLAKLMKSSPRVVRIFPDGGAGELMDISICGQNVKIGRGAASLAYLGKAATFFSSSHWTGSRFVFSMVPGPVASDYADRETFEHDFAGFYANCLEQIVLGPPEDMAPDSGFWSHLRY